MSSLGEATSMTGKLILIILVNLSQVVRPYNFPFLASNKIRSYFYIESVKKKKH